MNNTLSYFIEHYGSDKVRSGYVYYYELLFNSIREKVNTVLEIGIGTLQPEIPSSFCGNPSWYPHYKPGGSLRSWRDFFHNAQIYGVDVAEDCRIKEDRLETFIFSSLDTISAHKHFQNNSLDIIIDDGLHTGIGQLMTMQNFFCKVREGGFYIIEDCGGGGDGTNIAVDFEKNFKEIADNHEYFFGGNFIAIRKTNSKLGQVSFQELCELGNKEILTPIIEIENLLVESELHQDTNSYINYEMKEKTIFELKKVIRENNIKSAVEIPCGDFSWAKDIVYSFDSYTGCDISTEVISKNQKYSNSIIKFIELDATVNQIPTADLLILHDVLTQVSSEAASKLITNIINSKCRFLLTDISTREILCTTFNFPEPECYIENEFILWDAEKISSKKVGNDVAENLTVVTGLWNINRAGRDFSHYIANFKKFLEIPVNMFIYIPKELESLVWEIRSRNNTVVVHRSLEDFKENLYAPFWDKTQSIRLNPEWFNQTGEHGWLAGSPQAVNEWYNPIVQSKMFMLHDAKVTNPFNTDYFLWLDAGITNTVPASHLIENRALDNITKYMDTFLFLSYPYEASSEIHGFNFSEMNSIARETVKYVCRGGLFGGHKDYISSINATYYSLLHDTLTRGFMGTEESIFSLMSYMEPHIYKRYALDGNGLVVKFTQALIDDTVKLEAQPEKVKYNLPKGVYNPRTDKTSIYVLAFNFPEQFRTLLKSFEAHPEWLNRPRKILIDNSNKQEAIDEYDIICKEYGFEHIVTGENLGINRGRHFVAKHFDESDSDYYIFFEDDMCLHSPTEKTSCRNGFKKFIPNLYEKVHHIMAREKFDFLKLSFTEVYMDNNIQVSWYNVPQRIRTQIWPEYDKLPVSGLDPFAPRTKFNNINVWDELSYVSGDIYYANWPMIVSKEGNRKMFLTTEWARPFEQTWMSYMFQETIAGNLQPAVLLASPINHNRISHYPGEDRREN